MVHVNFTWNEVERKIHDVSNDGRRCELGEGVLQDLAEPRDRVASRLELPSLADDTSRVAGNKGAIERVQKGILQQEVAREEVDNSRTLVQDQQNRGENGKWAVHEDEDGKLGHIGEEKHGAEHSDGETQRGKDTGSEWLPKGPMSEKIEDSPEAIS